MNSTLEKMPMQENETKKMDTQFIGEVMSKDHSKELAMVGLIKNQVITLEEKLVEAKIKFAEIALDKDNWSGQYKRETDCKVLEGQIMILNKILANFETMLTPNKMM